MYLLVSEFLVCGGGELVLHEFHSQKVVFFLCGGNLGKQGCIGSTGNVSPLFLVCLKALIIVLDFKVFVSELAANRVNLLGV